MNGLDLPKLNGLDLFSGIGGLTLALSPWVRPIAYCENDRYAQAVLLSRQATGELPVSPIWDDVQTLDGSALSGDVDIIYGGFPCQDISVAGLGKGLVGERSGLFYQLLRLVREVSPRFVFLENVPAIRTRGLRQVVGAFTELGFDCRWTLVSAEEVGAPHRRSRWFLLAADAKRQGLEGYDTQTREPEVSEPRGSHRWEFEPDVGRVVNGLPFRVDRIKCLGNSVVPAQAREAFKRLSGVRQ